MNRRFRIARRVTPAALFAALLVTCSGPLGQSRPATHRPELSPPEPSAGLNPFSPVLPAMPLSQFLGRSRGQIDDLLRAGRPSSPDDEGWVDYGSISIRYDPRDTAAIALDLEIRPDEHWDWAGWRREHPGPPDSLTGAEALAYAGFSAPAAERVGETWLWQDGTVTFPDMPAGWTLDVRWSPATHRLSAQRVSGGGTR